jgi:predicted RNA binding protein YcfA (HicA-like mRNA interferase family)
MNAKLPVISGEDLIRALEKLRMRHATEALRLPVTVPLHDEIAFGTLKRILRDSKISTEELNSIL